MDFIFHGATNVALQKTIEQKKETPRVRWQGWWYAFLWGAIADLVPFTVPVVYSIFKGIAFWAGENPEMLQVSQNMYQYTHSLVIFGALFLLVRAITKKWHLPMLGWALHIVMDMPLHAPEYFPTPFLFPLSSWTLPFGISWTTWWIWGSVWIVLIGWFVWLKRNKKHD